MKTIDEIQIRPVKPSDGLVAFCSFVLFEAMYCDSVAIFTRPEGGYRLVYPTRKVGYSDMHVFHPLLKQVGVQIERAVIKKVEDVLNDRHYSNQP